MLDYYNGREPAVGSPHGIGEERAQFQRWVREGRIVIGRDPDCDLCFDERTLSRRHAELEVVSGEVKLIDLKSFNGSWVNRKRVEEQVLQPEDVVRLGQVWFSVEETTASSFKQEGVQDEDSWLFFSQRHSGGAGDTWEEA